MKKIIHSLVWFYRYKKGKIDREIREILSKVTIQDMYIKDFISKDDLIIDIGAHAGSWSVPLSELVPNGHVYAFEALPYYCDVLRPLLGWLGKSNITVLNYAILDKCGKTSMTYATENNTKLTGQTHITSAKDINSKKLTVEGITLDHFVYEIDDLSSKNISFIKIDVEGAEYLAIKGANKVICRNRPLLLVEVVNKFCSNYGNSAATLINHMKGMNYESYLLTGAKLGNLTPVNVDNYSGEKDTGTDIVFVPRELLHEYNNK